MKIEKLKIYDLEESMLASGYPMRTELVEDEVDDQQKGIAQRAGQCEKAQQHNGQVGKQEYHAGKDQRITSLMIFYRLLQ